LPLLHEIQEAIVQEGAELGPILLKLRFLASRLGSDTLEEWVKHESEGYPKDVEVPPYRIVGVSYTGTFSGPFGSGIRNAPIPSHLIKKLAGDSWVNYEVRESIAGVDELVRSTAESGSLSLNASNLILALQGKVYEDYACNSVHGSVSRTGLTEIQQIVRGRILELTLEIEKSIPAAAEVKFGAGEPPDANSEMVQQISQQIIYGNVTTAVAGGHGSNISVTVNERDQDSFVSCLAEAGITKEDASELGAILASESPESEDEPLGAKAKAWLASNINKAINGTWKTGISIATAVITEAAKKYYGL